MREKKVVKNIERKWFSLMYFILKFFVVMKINNIVRRKIIYLICIWHAIWGLKGIKTTMILFFACILFTYEISPNGENASRSCWVSISALRSPTKMWKCSEIRDILLDFFVHFLFCEGNLILFYCCFYIWGFSFVKMIRMITNLLFIVVLSNYWGLI